MRDEQLHEQIEAFLQGMMTDEEAAAFNAQIQSEPALEAKVNEHRAALLAVRAHAENDMRQRMDQWRNKQREVPQTPELTNGTTWRAISWLKWGLSLLAILLVATWLYRQSFPPVPSDYIPPTLPDTIPPVPKPGPPPEAPLPAPSPSSTPPPIAMNERMARGAFKPFGTAGILKRGNNPDDSNAVKDTLSLAKTRLQNGDATQALSLLKACQSCDSIDVVQWRGNAYFQLKRYKDAINDYKYWSEHGFAKKEAQWYLFLACLANNKKPEEVYATTLLKLQDEKHPKKEDFQALVKQMEEAGLSLK